MSTIKFSSPDGLSLIADEHLSRRRHGMGGDDVQELALRQLRMLLLDGATSAPTAPVDSAYCDGLRERVRHGSAGGTQG